MRFMLLMIFRGYGSAAAGTVPSAGLVARMMRYNASLQQAGVLLAGDGLQPPSVGARVTFENGHPTVIEGPYSSATEVLGGYWMIDVRSRSEAIEWAKRCPATEHETIEVRQVQEVSDFPPDVQAAAADSSAMKSDPAGQ